MKRLILLLLYVLWVVLFLTVGAIVRVIVPLLCFIPLSLCIIIFFTWRLTKEEYKISLFGGGISVTRTYGGKNPKRLLEARLKDIQRFTEYSEGEAEGREDRKVIYAKRNKGVKDTYVAVWSDTVLVFEANEQALKIINYYHST